MTHHRSSILKDAQVHPALTGGISWPYSPQQVCHSGQLLAGPGCGKNGTCWQFQIAGETERERAFRKKKKSAISPISLHFSKSKGLWKRWTWATSEDRLQEDL